MLEAWSLPFFQRAVLEILLLALVSGLLGTWIVLRGLSFFAHAAGAATVPGLVIADGLAFSPILGAVGAALVVAAAFVGVAGRRSVGTDSAVALVLAGALAVGVVLASDVFGSQGSVDRLLFGSLLAIGSAEILFAAAVLVAGALGTLLLGPRWLGDGFSGREPGAGRWEDIVLVALVSLAVVAALAAAGALLTAAILVLPAATTRLFVDRLARWQVATGLLAAVEGVAGLQLAVAFDLPPGPAIAVLGGATFAVAALARLLLKRSARPAGAVAAAALLLLGGCGGGAGTDGRLRVAATTPQVADIVREVGGPVVSVDQVIRPGVDSHDYELRPSDVAGVADARLLFTSGLGLDGWADSLLADSGSKARVIDLSAGLPVRRASGDEPDPHWWHDPRNLEAAATRAQLALSRADPGGARGFARRASAYRASIRRTDAAIRRCLERIPPSRRTVVTDHDALGYFTDRYGVTVVGAIFPATSTQGQASAGEVAALEQAIRDRQVKAVFPESTLNSALARRIAADTGAATGDPLYADSLGKPGSSESTVLGAMRANADALAGGLSGGRVRCSWP